MTPRRIILTGASGGLGRALVREYAAPGVSFLLIGRNAERLEAACAVGREAGAEVASALGSVSDLDPITAAMFRFEDAGGVDLLLLAAGVKTGNVNGVEPGEHLDRVLSVNLAATMHNVQALLPRMRARRSGQIAVFSSLAAIAPQPDLISYSASKAGLIGYGTALRRALLGSGVSVHVITPGFVDTPMTDRHRGRTPMKISAEKAAGIIRQGLARNKPFIAFPRALVLLIRLQNLLPAALSDRIDLAFRAEILPDDDERPAPSG